MTRWAFAASSTVIVLGLAAWLTSAWLCYLNWNRRGGGAKMATLEILRLVVITMIGFTLLRPELVRRTVLTEQPEVVVLFDASASMQTRDLVIDQTNVLRREEWLGQKRTENFWSPLEKTAKVRVQDFAAPPGTNDVASATFEEGTDLNQALDDVLNHAKHLKAVLVLTDGDWNLGKSPISAAMRYRGANVPIYAVGVGSQSPLPDLAVQSVSAPSYGLLGEQISIPYKLQNNLAHEVKTTVTLQSPKGVEASKQVTIPASSAFQDSIVWSPRAMGDFKLTVQVPVQSDEYLSDNNEQAFRVSVRAEKLKVLVVESLPRWEYRFLRNALARDPGVDVQCLLLHPGAGMKPGDGSNYIPAFPGSKELLSPYDVVFIGDVGIGSGELTEQDAELLKGLVEQQGSGIVFLPGSRGRQRTLLTSALRDLIPVLPEEGRPEGVRSPNESHLQLTSAGRGHFLTMLTPDEATNENLWKNLPGFYWCAAVQKSRPGAEVLAVHSSMRNEWGRVPLLVTQQSGSGKSLFMGTDSAWRWRRGVEDKYHYRFWGQVVRWMSHQRHLAQGQGIRLSFSPEDPHIGDTIFLQTTVLDASGFPIEKGNVVARIESPAGSTERLTFTPVTGGWGVFKASFLPQQGGRYKLTVTSESPARDLETEIIVTKPKREKLGQPTNALALREVADITHGTFGAPQELEKIVQTISALPEPQPIEKRLRLWAEAWWGGIIFALLAIYWTARKLAGMI